MTTTESTCPRCRSSKTELVQGPEKFEHHGQQLVFLDEFTRCAACGEEFYTTEQSLANSRAHTSAMRDADGLLNPEQIRSARLRLRMRQEDFEDALGVGRKTVARWESGTVSPSRAASGLLWIAANRPDAFLEYARSRVPDNVDTKVIALIDGHTGDGQPIVVKRLSSTTHSRGMVRATSDKPNDTMLPSKEQRFS